jgi:hypothetical protein
MRGGSKLYTQSALDLDRVQETFNLTSALVSKLLADDVMKNSRVRNALRKTHEEVKRFRDKDLADFLDWCNIMRRRTKGNAGAPFRDELIALQEHLASGVGLVAVKHAHGGKDAERICGVSMYWSEKKFSAAYDKLDFALSQWGKRWKRLR